MQDEYLNLTEQIRQSPIMNEVNLREMRDLCLTSKPFRHISIDGLWNNSFLEKVSDEVNNFTDWAGEKQFFGSREKKWQSDFEKLPENTHKLLTHLSHPLMLRVIEYLTNEKHLISDPYLEGGGIHSTGQNGFLKLHADFNWNERLQLYRRINILIYLNKDWRKDFGGQIELAGVASNGKLHRIVSLEPIFNRTLIFVTDDSSYHGQPNPVQHPEFKRRNSIAAYYYQSAKPIGTSSSKRIGTEYVNYNDKKRIKNFLRDIKSKILGKII